MREVTVDKTKLREIVKTNRDQHRGQYEKAMEGYIASTFQALEEHAAALRKDRRHRVYITDPAPEDHTHDYDVVLKMIDMSVDNTITLDQASFRQYVEDDWQWKHAWTVGNSKYMG